MIKDQLDTNMTLRPQQVSTELEINPAYLSHEFPNILIIYSFGDYIFGKCVLIKAIRGAMRLLSLTEGRLPSVEAISPGYSKETETGVETIHL